MLGTTRTLRAWFVGAGLTFLAGCGSLIGLEDRSIDESELGDGYAGCLPGGPCDGCINQSHHDTCVGSDSGGAGGSTGGNGGNSGNGGSAGDGGFGAGTSSVSTDVGGASGASNAGGAAGSAGFGGVAGGAGSSSGGAGGAPILCGDDAPVDSCDACVCDTCRSQLEYCAGDVGCIEIWTCFDQQACDPTPGVANSCFDPEHCQNAIMNNGGPEGEPIALVQAMLGCAIEACGCGNNANCTLDNGCECDSCQAACECAGYPSEYCTNTCNSGPVQCGSAGQGACLGCTSCIGQCECAGNTELDCLIACGLSTCDADCQACDNGVDSCVCGVGSTSASCSEEQLGMSCYDYYTLQVSAERVDCSTCGCETCPALNTRCEFDPTGANGVSGCVALLECLESTGCASEGCDQAATCGNLLSDLGGLQGYSMQIAEGLLACKNLQGCQGCSDPGGNTGITCGSQTCYSYEGSGVGATAPACCTGQDSSMCGYEIGAFFPSPAGQCFPGQAPGDANAGCPSVQVTTETYSAYLSGCCNPMMAACGLLETQIGLGCVPYDVVGQPNPSPAIACSP